MNLSKLSRNKIILAALFLLLSQNISGQADIVKSDGITSPLHQANVGKIAFTAAIHFTGNPQIGERWKGK